MGTQLTCCLLGLAAFLYNRHRKKTTTLYLEAQWGGGRAMASLGQTTPYRHTATLQRGHLVRFRVAVCQARPGVSLRVRAPPGTGRKQEMASLQVSLWEENPGAWVPDLSRRLSDGFQPPPASSSISLPSPAQTLPFSRGHVQNGPVHSAQNAEGCLRKPIDDVQPSYPGQLIGYFKDEDRHAQHVSLSTQVKS